MPVTLQVIALTMHSVCMRKFDYGTMINTKVLNKTRSHICQSRRAIYRGWKFATFNPQFRKVGVSFGNVQYLKYENCRRVYYIRINNKKNFNVSCKGFRRPESFSSKIAIIFPFSVRKIERELVLSEIWNTYLPWSAFPAVALRMLSCRTILRRNETVVASHTTVAGVEPHSGQQLPSEKSMANNFRYEYQA